MSTQDPPNKAAIVAALTKHSISFAEGESETKDGWVLEILDRVEGKTLDDLVKIADTSQNVVIVIQPNVGMTIGTEGAVGQ